MFISIFNPANNPPVIHAPWLQASKLRETSRETRPWSAVVQLCKTAVELVSGKIAKSLWLPLTSQSTLLGKRCCFSQMTKSWKLRLYVYTEEHWMISPKQFRIVRAKLSVVCLYYFILLFCYFPFFSVQEGGPERRSRKRGLCFVYPLIWPRRELPKMLFICTKFWPIPKLQRKISCFYLWYQYPCPAIWKKKISWLRIF